MTAPPGAQSLNDAPPRAKDGSVMKLALPLLLALAASPSDAACYADYKARQDRPLKLHYGTIEVRGACNPSAAQSEIQDRLARAGWTLLTVIGTFGESGLAERERSAGAYHLRF